MNENWQRWTKASVNTWYTNLLKTQANLKYYFEGAPATNMTEKDWIEVRMDGVDLHPETKDEYQGSIEVNILVSSAMDATNNYRIDKNLGLVQQAMMQTIPVFKYGKETGDDSSFVTCLQLKQQGKELLKTSNFGRIDKDRPILQMSVEGHYFGRYSA